MKKTVKLPPISYQDYPVDVQIRIYKYGANYRMDIQAVGKCLQVPIDMSPNDLSILSKRLKDEIEKIAIADSSFDIEHFRKLAEIGYYAYKRVFSHPQAKSAIQSITSLSSKVSFQITSEDFFLPWELIYPFNLDIPLAIENFWGVNHIISRIIAQDLGLGSFASPVILFSQLRLGLFAFQELEFVNKHEIPFFEELANKGRIELFKLRPLNPEKRRDELNEFKIFWDKSFHIAHFACHASYEEIPDLSYILLSDEFSISIQDLETHDFVIKNSPIIMINACETGNLNPLYTPFFARAFLRYGARGVIATECAVPDLFASNFSNKFYDYLLAGETIGESLLKARRYFVQNHNNLAGLLYSMYASPSIRLSQIKKKDRVLYHGNFRKKKVTGEGIGNDRRERNGSTD